ncbi:MAG: hypothetical protein ABSE64_07555 [Vulcanimicrobiaceae bacterium]|jgi:fructoselysine-6-P-deglycase FrlB-like protein
MPGERFEREIREQPAVWRRIAESSKAQELARAIGNGPVCLVGSGSSLFVAQLGALALRRRGIVASALAATEARFDRETYRNGCVIALSQSGRSSDVLAALRRRCAKLRTTFRAGSRATVGAKRTNRRSLWRALVRWRLSVPVTAFRLLTSWR